MLGLKKKKKTMEEKVEEKQSEGKIHLTKEMPQIVKDLPSNVPQARLIRQQGSIVDFEVEYNLNELVYKVNGVRAMAYRRRVAKDEFLLGTSGIGFFARSGQVIDFDNLKIIQ